MPQGGCSLELQELQVDQWNTHLHGLLAQVAQVAQVALVAQFQSKLPRHSSREDLEDHLLLNWGTRRNHTRLEALVDRDHHERLSAQSSCSSNQRNSCQEVQVVLAAQAVLELLRCHQVAPADLADL